MYMPDPTTVQIIHQDRIRELERRIRPLSLTFGDEDCAPVQADQGIISSVRRWLRATPAQRPAADVRRQPVTDPCQPHAV